MEEVCFAAAEPGQSTIVETTMDCTVYQMKLHKNVRHKLKAETELDPET